MVSFNWFTITPLTIHWLTTDIDTDDDRHLTTDTNTGNTYQLLMTPPTSPPHHSSFTGWFIDLILMTDNWTAQTLTPLTGPDLDLDYYCNTTTQYINWQDEHHWYRSTITLNTLHCTTHDIHYNGNRDDRTIDWSTGHQYNWLWHHW